MPGDPEGAEPALAELLERYAARTVLTPRPDWTRQVHERIAQEAALTPSRRFFLALGALAPRQMLLAVRQSAAAVFGRGAFPAAVRAQALAVMLIAALSVGVVGAGGAMVLQAILPPADGPTRTQPQPTLQPIRTDAPTPRRTPTGESPAMRVDDRSPADPTSAAPTPAVGGQPSPPADGRGISGPSNEDGSKKPHPTPRSEKPQKPHPTPRSEQPQKPHPTPRSEQPQKPHPTPRSEQPQKPHPTPRADKAQKPHPTPRADKAQKPHPTPRADKTQESRPTPRGGKPEGSSVGSLVAASDTLSQPARIG